MSWCPPYRGVCVCVSSHVCAHVLLQNFMGWGWDESHHKVGRQAGRRPKGQDSWGRTPHCLPLAAILCWFEPPSQSPGNWGQDIPILPGTSPLG